ncbi:hypothetical protein NMY22_g4727 [Coprinellus aureogranulatus]|nr:hypothetical protein NMY22_g4727 [Coprinellus aureogranulatus]
MISATNKAKATKANQDATGNPSYPSFTTTTESYAHGLYLDAAQDDDIEKFISETEFYDTRRRRWSFLDTSTTTECLIDTFFSILSSIVQRFVKPHQPGVERELVSTIGVPECETINERGYRKWPVLILHAAGPSFELPQPLDSTSRSGEEAREIGFSCMATFFHIKLSEVGSPEDQLDEIAMHVRNILQEQPNRYFVRSLVLTEKHLRLVHFDRAGAEITPVIDIHRNPNILIRLVAGLSSGDERRLGIDTSIQWAISSGRKVEGMLTTNGPTGELKTYPILDRIPTSRHSTFSRGTTCWRVQDPDTFEELVVKDSWRPDDLRPEHQLLELVKGIPGVVQMVSYQTGRGETRDMRCPSAKGQYRNRVATRVTMKAYGSPIECFTSPHQVLCALRDAIAGHEALLAEHIRILHRDISAQNVLLGREGAPPGERGILIDLDLAFRATEAKPTSKVDYNIGVRIFQSLSVLGSHYEEDIAPPHDYLDDLESFFYLMVYIFLRYRPDGSRHSSGEEGPSLLLGWASDDPSEAHANKERLFGPTKIARRLINIEWGSACVKLYNEFRDWISSRRDDKEELEARGSVNEPLPSQRKKHYSEVLAMLDDAISSLRPPAVDVAPSQSDQPESAITIPASGQGEPAESRAHSPSVNARSHSTVIPIGQVTPVTQPRRSSRIKKLLEKAVAPPTVNAPKSTFPASPANPAEVRRSTRIANLKRQREEDNQPVAPASNAKRKRRRWRVTTFPIAPLTGARRQRLGHVELRTNRRTHPFLLGFLVEVLESSLDASFSLHWLRPLALALRYGFMMTLTTDNAKATKPNHDAAGNPSYPNFTTTTELYAHGLYLDVARDEEIESFLSENALYDGKRRRWSTLDTTSTTESLVDSLFEILSSTVKRFAKSHEPGVERKLVNTLLIPDCAAADEKGYQKWPFLVLHAAGPSFELPDRPEPASPSDEELQSVGFSCMATFFHVKQGSEVGTTEKELDEMEKHVRQILLQQPNRYFVRLLFLTEEHLRLVHFDRAGAEITPPIDLHQNPTIFIRLVAGLSSSDEHRLGIDTSIQWSIVNGMKGKGTLTTTSSSGELKTYPILERIRDFAESTFW